MSDSKNLLSVTLTTASEREARAIALALVDERLAACVNIVPQILSVYRWEDKIEEEHEALLIVKTKASVFKELVRRIESLHSYTCPSVVAEPLTHASEATLAWITQNVKDK